MVPGCGVAPVPCHDGNRFVQVVVGRVVSQVGGATVVARRDSAYPEPLVAGTPERSFNPVVPLIFVPDFVFAALANSLCWELNFGTTVRYADFFIQSHYPELAVTIAASNLTPSVAQAVRYQPHL